jgi:uncharacterized protein
MMGRRLPLVAALLLALPAVAQAPVPALSGRVVDGAGLLSPHALERLEGLLEAHEQATTDQVVVLTIDTLEGESVESVANRIFRAWGLGRAGRDNGVLLLIAHADRELRIEVGYGLEGALTDAQAGRVIRNVIVPRFRDGDFEGGILEGVEAILGLLAGTYTPPESEESIPWPMVLIFAITHMLLPLGFAVRAMVVSPPGPRYAAYVFFGLFIVPTAFFLLPGLLGKLVLGLYVAGYPLADLVVSRLPGIQAVRREAAAATKRGGTATVRVGGMSFRVGGSSSGGSGGGFSGGGGSSGGGGASGSW